MSEYINIGSFDTLVVVEESTDSRGSRGEAVKDWSELTRFMANVVQSIDESEGQQSTIDKASVTVTTHHLQSSINTRHRLLIDGLYYNIKRVNPIKRVFITIDATETE